MYVYVYLINVTTCYYLHLFPGPYKQSSPPSPACHVVSSPVCLTYFWIHTMLVRGYNGSPLKIHRHTVHPDAFVVVILTVQLPVRKVRTFQQNVRFVLVTIRQIIGDVQFLKISKFTKNRRSQANKNHHLNNNNRSYKKKYNCHNPPQSKQYLRKSMLPYYYKFILRSGNSK